MLTGKRFRLKRATFGIESVGENRVPVRVPANEVVRVLRGPGPNERDILDVRWKDRTLVMFAVDIEQRAEEIGTKSADA